MGDKTEPLLDKTQIFIAAWVIDDALDGHKCPKYPSGDDAKRLRKQKDSIHHSQGRFQLSLYMFMLLLLFEPPLWCQNSENTTTFISGEERCPLPDGTKPEMWGLPMLPPVLSLLLEIIALAIAVEAMTHEINVYKNAVQMGAPGIRTKEAIPEFMLKVAWVMAADICYYALFRQSSFRFAPYGRIILLFYWPRVRNVFHAAVNCVDELCNILLFIGLSVVFFGWFLTQCLDTIADRRGGPDLKEIGGDTFGSFQSSMFSLFEMQTGANYPDDMVPLYTEMRWIGNIMYPYMFLTFFLWTNLMLAVVYNAYTEETTSQMETFFKTRVKGVAKAFNKIAIEIDNEDGEKEKVVTYETFGILCDYLRAIPKFSKQVTEENEKIIFTAIDDNGNGFLSLKEFLDACDYVQMTYTVTPMKSKFQEKGYKFDFVQGICDNGCLKTIMNIVLFLNMVFILRNTVHEYGDESNKQVPHALWWAPAEVFFLLVYPVEVMLRLLVTSFGTYTVDGSNCYSLFVSLVLLGSAIYTLFPGGWDSVIEALPVLNLLRILKLFQLLTGLEQFKTMVACMHQLALVSTDMMILLFVTMGGFAVVALQCYGGLLYPTNPVLQGSDYLAAPYDLFNFNDMMGSLLSLFNIMVNNWMPEYVDAMGLVSPYYPLGFAFSFVYFCIAISISFNIFTAFLIDIFCSLQEGMQDEPEEGSEEAAEDANMERMKKDLEKQEKLLSVYVPGAVLKSRVMLALLELDDIVDEAEDAAEEEGGDGGEAGEEEKKEEEEEKKEEEEEEKPKESKHAEVVPTDKKFDFGYASWMLEDALMGKLHPKYPHGGHHKRLRQQMNELMISRGNFFKGLVVLIALLFFESPTWCQNSVKSDSWLSAAERCPLPGGHKAEMTGLPVLPPYMGMVIEAVAMLTVQGTLKRNIKIITEFEKLEINRRLTHEQPEFFLKVVWFMWADLAIYFYGIQCGWQQRFRFAPFGRLMLAFYFPKVQLVFAAALSCWDEFLNLFLLMMAAIVVFVWFTMMTLGEYCQAVGSSLKKVGGTPFDSFGHIMDSMWTLSTGANMPDQFVPLVTELKWTAWIFYIFLLLTFFLFTQLMLAIVYNAYQGTVQDQLKTYFVHRVKGAAKAFNAVAHETADGEKVLKQEHFHQLCHHLSQVPEFKHIKDKTSDVVFAALDDDGSGLLSMNEFFDAVEMLLIQFWVTSRESKLATMLKIPNEGLKAIVESGQLVKYFNLILVANVAHIAAMSYYDFQNIANPSWVHPLTLFFCFIYMVEVMVNLLTTSWAAYMSEFMNKYNFVVSVALFASGIATFLPSLHDDVLDAIPFLNALRVLRLLEVCMNLPHFKVMHKCLNQLIKVSGDMATLMFMTMMFFAVFGSQCFGGLLTPHNPVLAGSDYLAAPYNIFNFNDMAGSFLCLFNMVVSSYMPEYADAMTRVWPGPFSWVGWGFCSAWFFLGVNVAFNVFQSFLIDIFCAIQEKATEEAEDAEEGEASGEDANLAKMRKKLDEEGLNLHMYIPPAVEKARAMVAALDDIEDIIADAQEDVEEEEKVEDEVENGK